MLKLRTIQQQDKTLRSSVAQAQVIGFSLDKIKSALVIKWSLPKLLITRVDDQHEKPERVRNVLLAVNLARHLANSWDDAVLSDDYRDIAELLKLNVNEVINLVDDKSDKNYAANIAFT